MIGLQPENRATILLQLYLLPWEQLNVNKMEDDRGVFAGETVEEFRTYEDFLDSQIKPLDLFYLKVTYKSNSLYVKLSVSCDVVSFTNVVRSDASRKLLSFVSLLNPHFY